MAQSLLEIWESCPHGSDEVFYERDVVRDLTLIEGLDSEDREWWVVRSEILDRVARNSLEQFSRGKYDAAMETMRAYEKLRDELVERSDKIRESSGF